MIDKEYGELSVGDVRHSNGRTVTETDVVTFCMLTGNWLELHSNAEFAKSTRFGQRVVQGSLVFSIVNAMFPFDSGLVEGIGKRIEEHPIVFVERATGRSKMHVGIVIEALARVTGWGIADRVKRS